MACSIDAQRAGFNACPMLIAFLRYPIDVSRNAEKEIPESGNEFKYLSNLSIQEIYQTVKHLSTPFSVLPIGN